MPARAHLAVSTVLTAIILASAPASSVSSDRIRFTALTKASPSGLPSDVVRDIVQDVGSYVWIATDQGVARFDGWETLHFQHDPADPESISSNHVTAVAAPASRWGEIWLGTSLDGLVRIDGRTNKSTRFRSGATGTENLLSDSITSLAFSEDRFLWIGTEKGLCVYSVDTQTFAPARGFPEDVPVSFVEVLGKVDVWAATADGALYHWNVETSEFEQAWKTSVPVSSVALDPSGRLWVGTLGSGLHSRSGNGKFERVDAFEPDDATAVLCDSTGGIWVGTNEGLATYDRESRSFHFFRSNPRHGDTIAGDRISTIYEDRSQKTLWIGTASGGTSRFHLDSEWFTHVRPNSSSGDGLPDPVVRSIATGPDGTLWLATDEGLANWNPEKERFLPRPTLPGTDDSGFSSLAFEEDGTAWIGMRGNGLLRRSPEGQTTHFRHDPNDLSSLPHDNVTSLLRTFSGRLYVGTAGGGLCLFEPGGKRDSFRPLRHEQGDRPLFVETLAEDSDGNMWIASRTGVYLYFPGPGRLTPLQEAHPSTAPLTSARIVSILPDSSGIVWLGTSDSGLDRLNLATGQITNFNSAVHGLPDDEIRSLAKDGSGLLWVATRSGISRLDAMQSQFRVFDHEDGLQRDGFLPNSFARSEKGVLYFGGMDGFNAIDPTDLPSRLQMPLPILTGFEMFGEPVIPTPGGILEKEIAATEEIRIAYDARNRFAIRFGNLDFRAPGKGHFRHMLKGLEEKWQIAGDERKASYSALAPGRYTFLVQNSIDGREWSNTSAKVNIWITPPWYNSWWFRGLSFFLAVVFIYAGTRYAIHRRVRTMALREQRLTAQRDKAEAELARQLQNRMLVERTTAQLRSDLREDQLLSEPLSGIVKQFGATHCLIHRLSENSDQESGIKELKQIGYFGPRLSAVDGVSPRLLIQHPLVQKILDSESVVVVDDPNALPSSVRGAFESGSKISLIAVKTYFLDQANGLVTLLRTDCDNEWTTSDTKLLEALSGQFGIAIAQLDTAETEERYRRHLEEAKHDAEVANRAKSDFLAKMTHELRTPLNAIIGFSEILGADPSLKQKQRETLDIINNSGEHLLDVINEILDLSKIEAGKIEKNDEVFSLVPLLKSVYEMLALKANSKRIGFHFTAHSALPGEIETDRSKLRQILINLIGNAIKFTSQGAVSLGVKVTALGEPEERDHRLRRRIRVEFEVKDTGKGISEEEIPKLFERYTQTESGRRSTEGTGLGLPIAKSFVELLGGDVEVASELGQGTVFRFHIECEELAPARASTGEVSSVLDEDAARRIIGFDAPDAGEIRILVAEDQPTNRMLLRKILGKAGFVIEEVENGADAVAKWREWRPHLIFMDEDMPVMKGSEAAREITGIVGPEEKPVIVSLTAYALEQARIGALEAGCTDFVAKPFRSHELFSVISKHLGVTYRFKEVA